MKSKKVHKTYIFEKMNDGFRNLYYLRVLKTNIMTTQIQSQSIQEESVVRNFRTIAADGKSYLTTFYNLDMIIALGYRVRSIIATRFRQWAIDDYE